MKHALYGATALVISCGTAMAGGIERSGINYGLMFQEGDQIELSFSSVSPNVSGTYAAPLAVGGGQASTQNMSNKYVTLGFGYKNDITDKMSFGIFAGNPYGADAEYTGGFYNGLTAEWDSNQIAAIVKYQLGDRISVYGGARYVQSTAQITIPDQMLRASTGAAAAEAQAAADGLAAAGVPATDPRFVQASTIAAQLGAVVASPAGALEYNANGQQRGDWGYILGAAYEIPDIALRVGLTWESAITHKFDTAETLPGFGLNGSSTTEIEMPQSITLDFQTGVAPGTLVFGSVKWAEWSQWEVRPPGYAAITGDNVTDFDNDTVTYKLGIGRQFSENFSGFAQVGYEAAQGGVASRLAPTDGRTSFGIGGQFTHGAMKLRGGVEYVKLGDATDGSGTVFEGNDALGVGMSITFSF